MPRSKRETFRELRADLKRGMLADDTTATALAAVFARYAQAMAEPGHRKALRLEGKQIEGAKQIETWFLEKFYIFYDNLEWDGANNLISIRDSANHTYFPDTQKPRKAIIDHDSLYRVTGVDYTYRTVSGYGPAASATATDPRDEQTFHNLADPMRRAPAPMVSSLADARPNNLTYDYDWLGNQTVWNDDAHAFYERSLGTSDASRRDLLNGTDANENSSGHRPAALYFASNVDHMGGAPNSSIDRGGWLEVEYGESGNVLSMTVRGQCHDTDAVLPDNPGTICDDPGGTDEGARAASLQTNCVCNTEQHYQYRWDALNRLDSARRYDRGQSRSNWELQVRQQYRYDGANVRMVKRTRDGFSHGAGMNGQDGLGQCPARC